MQTTISHAWKELFRLLSEAAFPQAAAATEHNQGNTALAIHALCLLPLENEVFLRLKYPDP